MQQTLLKIKSINDFSIYRFKVTEKEVSIPQRAVDMSVFGHEVTEQKHVDTAIERRGLVTGIRAKATALDAVKVRSEKDANFE